MFNEIFSALGAHKNRLLKAGAIGFAVITAFVLIPFENNPWLFFVKFLPLAAALGFFASQIPGASLAAFWKKGSGFLKLALAALIVFGFFLPKTGRAIWAKAPELDKAFAATSEKFIGGIGPSIPREAASTTTKRIAINEAWSGWVDVPEGWAARIKDGAGNPIEVKFWDGRIVSDAPNSPGAPVDRKWVGKVNNCSFQIRRISGEGTAVVTMTRS